MAAKNIGELCMRFENHGNRLKSIFSEMPKRWQKQTLVILKKVSPELYSFLHDWGIPCHPHERACVAISKTVYFALLSFRAWSVIPVKKLQQMEKARLRFFKNMSKMSDSFRGEDAVTLENVLEEVAIAAKKTEHAQE